MMFKGIWNRVRGVEEPEQKKKSKPQTPDEAAEAFHQELNRIIESYISDQENGEKTLPEAIDDLIWRTDHAYIDYLRASGKPDNEISRKRRIQISFSMTYPPSFTHVSE